MPGVLRQILRLVPAVSARRVRSHIVSLVRSSSGAEAAALPGLGCELRFYLQAQRYQRELNERYFPASELTDREKIHRMARIVGLEAPPHVPLEGSPPPPQTPQ